MKDRKSKVDLIIIGIIGISYLLFVWYLLKDGYLYGSKTDWDTQHFAIPEYFRTLFYKTHELFPSFAFNIGAGENIYNFSYYGLHSPIILFSYLLPWVDMVTYIQVSCVIIVLVSLVLFYYWMRRKFDYKISLAATIIFICATPLIFHSHRHIMFINYMPFLIMALMGVDRYFEKKKRGLMIISTFLIIMSSYFFSVGALCAIVIYGVGVYLGRTEKVILKDLLMEGLRFALNIVISICMAGVLLLPTVYTLLSGRSETNVSVSLMEILLPTFNTDLTLYSSYSMGLSAVYIVAIIYSIYTLKKKNVFWGIVMGLFTLFPVFAYILNGTMYIDGKAIIPFLPLACLMIAQYYDGMLKKEYSFIKLFLCVLAANIVLICMIKDSKERYIYDCLEAVACFVIFSMIMKVHLPRKLSIYQRIKDKKVVKYTINVLRSIIKLFRRGMIPYVILVAATLISSVFTCIGNNLDDAMVKKSDYESSDASTIRRLIDKADKDGNVYRISNNICAMQNSNRIYDISQYATSVYSSVSNGDYKNFFFNEICNNNPYRNSAILSHNDNLLFNIYMGNKYVISKKYNSFGYKENSKDNGYTLFENDYVMPIAYATDKVMSYSEYEKLEYPYTVEAMLKYAVVENIDKNSEYKTTIKPLDTEYKVDYGEGLKISKSANERYRVDTNVSKNCDSSLVDEMFCTAKVGFKEKLNNSLLMINFMVDNSFCVKRLSAEGVDRQGNETIVKSKGDTIISINGIKNKLTVPWWKYYNENESFEYTISQNEDIDSLDVDFYYGRYDIYDMKAYTISTDEIKKLSTDVDEFKIDKDKTVGDVIEGNIDVKADGYFKMSVPYDKGFSVYIDGKKTEYEKVDSAFLGFKIDKGKHNIRISYRAPLLNIGLLVSILGCIGCALIVFPIKTIILKNK